MTTMVSVASTFLLISSLVLMISTVDTTELANKTDDCIQPIFSYLSGDSGHVTCSNAGNMFSCLPPEVNNVSQLTINLDGCHLGIALRLHFFPVGLFDVNNIITVLRVYSPVEEKQRAARSGIEKIKNGTFENLYGLEELHLEGFQSVRVLESEVFRPLVGLRSLTFVGFGADYLTYLDLGVALTQLSGSQLERITFDGIHSSSNNEKELNLEELFQLSDVRITSLEFVNNDINIVRGRLSTFLPHLKSVTVSAFWVYAYATVNFGIDSFVLLESLESLQFAFVERNSGSTSSRGDVVIRWPPEPETICVKCMLEIQILDYFLSLSSSADCYFNRTAVIGRRLRSITVRGMDFFRDERMVDVCLNEENSLEYLDLTGSRIAALEGTVRGLKRLRYLSLCDVGLTHLSDALFRDMPAIEVLLLSGNDLDATFSGNSSLFTNLTLKTLDVSNSRLTFIPRTMFSWLASIEFLNLSQNKIETIEVELMGCGNLSLLNLSDNSIRMLSADMIFELESLQSSGDNGTKLTIDLNRNPLSCLCNATDFVIWLKSTKKVSFENIEEYMCLHPNGSKVSINRLNITELLNDCKSLGQLQSTCPCEDLDYKHLRQISLSLTDVYCTYDSKRLSYPDLVANTSKTLEEHWWCRGVVTRENPFFKSPGFIAPTTIVFLALLVLSVGLFIIYRRRRFCGADADLLLPDDLDLPLSDEVQCEYDFDAFLCAHSDDRLWVETAVRRRLNHLRVITQEDFLPGSAIVDAIIDSLDKSRVIVFVLSSSFMRDGWCREAVLRAFSTRRRAIRSVILDDDLIVNDIQNDNLLKHLSNTNFPLRLSDYESEETFYEDLVNRILQCS